MLNLLIGWREFKTKFHGHEIKMELYPLNREAMIVLAPIMARSISNEDKVALYLETFEMPQIASSVLPKHARNITGIMINGKVPTFEQIAEEAVLAELAVVILGKLFTITSVKEVEEKN